MASEMHTAAKKLQKGATMSDANATEMVMILDRSGSMGGLESDVIGGFNAMVEKQRKQEGRAYLTTILFSGKSFCLHDRLDIGKVPLMTGDTYTVGGCTALCDAIGDAIRHIETVHRYVRPEDVPARCVFIIMTDGLENASHRYTADEVRLMIEEKKHEKGWDFLFLGANMDAVETAKSYGIDAGGAVDFDCDEDGVRVSYDTLNEALTTYREAPPTDEVFHDGSWSEKIRENHRRRVKKQ